MGSGKTILARQAFVDRIIGTLEEAWNLQKTPERLHSIFDLYQGGRRIRVEIKTTIDEVTNEK